MEKKISLLDELKRTRKLIEDLKSTEEELSKPLLQDYNLIHEIYYWFVDIISEANCSPNIDSVFQRKKFLFIVLFLFAPKTLIGSRVPNGIRAELSKLFPKISPCVISNNIADIFFYYTVYEDFQSDIDNILFRIMEKLNDRGLINIGKRM